MVSDPVRTTHSTTRVAGNVPGMLFVLMTLKEVPTLNLTWI